MSRSTQWGSGKTEKPSLGDPESLASILTDRERGEESRQMREVERAPSVKGQRAGTPGILGHGEQIRLARAWDF